MHDEPRLAANRVLEKFGVTARNRHLAELAGGCV